MCMVNFTFTRINTVHMFQQICYKFMGLEATCMCVFTFIRITFPRYEKKIYTNSIYTHEIGKIFLWFHAKKKYNKI